MAEGPLRTQRKPQKKISEYGYQLQEKQKTKLVYGVREAQFRRYFEIAAKNRAQTGKTLLQLLERRLDNVVFRSGLALSRPHARQMVSHRHFTLNGRRVSAPSTSVSPGDVIAPVKISGRELRQDITPSNWLSVDKKTLKIKVDRIPEDNDLPIEFDTQKIVEFYSR